MQKPWVNVALFEDVNSAHALQDHFRKKGMESRVICDKVLQVLLFLNPPRTTWRVEVRGNFYHFATDLLAKNPPDILEKAIHCPHCGSLGVSYPHLTRPSPLSALGFHLGLLFHVTDHQCYCENCHAIWGLPKLHAAEVAHASAAPKI